MEDGATGVGAVVMRPLSDDVYSLCLVKECRELETYYGKKPSQRLYGWMPTLSVTVLLKKTLKVINSREVCYEVIYCQCFQ